MVPDPLGFMFTWTFNRLRNTAHRLGWKMKVVHGEHTTEIQFLRPDRTELAWDNRMYLDSNHFIEGYSTPFKARPDHQNPIDGDPDQVISVQESEKVESAEEAPTAIISSDRHETLMLNDAIEKLMTLTTTKRLLYLLVGVAFLQSVTMIGMMYGFGWV